MSARRGVLLFVLVLSVIGTAVLFAALRLRGPSGGASAGTLLVFDVPDELPEGDTPARPLSLGFRRSHSVTHQPNLHRGHPRLLPAAVQRLRKASVSFNMPTVMATTRFPMMSSSSCGKQLQDWHVIRRKKVARICRST